MKDRYKNALFVSDLDGTLLQSDQKTSEYTNTVINKFIERGFTFSFATARSIYTAKEVTRGLYAKMPVITYNGSFIIDNSTFKKLDSCYLGDDAKNILLDMFSADIYPIVYSIIDGRERFSYFEQMCSQATLDFVLTREDERKRLVYSSKELLLGDIFYITCIDDEEKLLPFFEKYKDKYHCIFQQDIYSGEQWLEIMPKNATKASAVSRLKSITGCDYVVVFGDGINDIEMFELADEKYAVENAVPELKEIATSIIRSNNFDGVARWIEENFL